MSKVVIDVIIKNNSNEIKFEAKGILNENTNILIYSDDEYKNILDINNNILTRENKEFKMILEFNKEQNTETKVYIKKTNTNIFVILDTLNIYKSKGIYKVTYEIENQGKVEYEIKYKFM